MNENTEEIKLTQYDEEYFNTRKRLLVFFFIFLSALVVFYFVSMILLSRGYREAKSAAYYNSITASRDTDPKLVIIIDAGHGGEDGGASANGQVEKNLNLAVAKKLGEFLSLSGYDVVFTRTEDKLLYKPGQEGRMKYYDLRNRLEFVELNESCLFVSIHMNKFPLESSKGLQVFYSKNHLFSKQLAQSIQSEAKQIDEANKRLIKPATSQIYILDVITKPAVIIECGFLSNPTEASLLADNDYQNKLAFVIYSGITKAISSSE